MCREKLKTITKKCSVTLSYNSDQNQFIARNVAYIILKLRLKDIHVDTSLKMFSFAGSD